MIFVFYLETPLRRTDRTALCCSKSCQPRRSSWTTASVGTRRPASVPPSHRRPPGRRSCPVAGWIVSRETRDAWRDALCQRAALCDARPGCAPQSALHAGRRGTRARARETRHAAGCSDRACSSAGAAAGAAAARQPAYQARRRVACGSPDPWRRLVLRSRPVGGAALSAPLHPIPQARVRGGARCAAGHTVPSVVRA